MCREERKHEKSLVTGLMAVVMTVGTMSACGSNTEVAAQSGTTEGILSDESKTKEESTGDSSTKIVSDEEAKKAGILNDYENTEELLEKFPILNETPVEDGIGKKIQNRLLTGFENWNRGFDAWKAWGISFIRESPFTMYTEHV